MILQRIGIIVGFEPGTSAPEVLYAANEPPHLHEPPHLLNIAFIFRFLNFFSTFCSFLPIYEKLAESDSSTQCHIVPESLENVT